MDRVGEGTHLNHSLSHLEEVLLAIRLGTLLMPINDSLVRDDIVVVQNLEDLGESLQYTGVGVA